MSNAATQSAQVTVSTDGIFTTFSRGCYRVTMSANAPGNPSSRWTLFAEGSGATLTAFDGKSYASAKTAEKAARAWLMSRDLDAPKASTGPVDASGLDAYLDGLATIETPNGTIYLDRA